MIIVDCDGTLADVEHRRHHLETKDWKSFFEAMVDDGPMWKIIDVVEELRDVGHEVIICTGRPSDYEQQTVEWLERYGIQYERLMMRDAGDYRSDVIIKREMLQVIRNEHLEDPDLVFDDRQCVVDMWRDEGLTCLQVAPGDFDKPKYKQGILALLVGPSGAGKSTFIKDSSNVISSDNLRELLSGHFKDQTKNNQVFAALHALVKTNLDHGLNVIVDATNIRNADRRKLRDLCAPDTRINYLVIDRPLEDKIRDGGWRNDVIIKGQTLIERHAEIFKNNLKDILNGDNDERVHVFDLRVK